MTAATCGCITSQRRWESDPLNGDPSGCYCDCAEYGYEGCEHDTEKPREVSA